jgi:ABC-type nitrate/sulfonate/bicarbonate transport system permease component
VSETSSSVVKIIAVPKPAYQPSGVFRVRTIELIWSVTVPKVCPGAITGGRPAPTIAWFGSSIG